MEGQAYIYVVIEFIDERSVGVVHKSWIESSDEVHYIYHVNTVFFSFDNFMVSVVQKV